MVEGNGFLAGPRPSLQPRHGKSAGMLSNDWLFGPAKAFEPAHGGGKPFGVMPHFELSLIHI